MSASSLEAGQEAEVNAVVTDVETPVNQLTFDWTSSPSGGTFTGTGSRVVWRAPVGGTSPGTYEIRLAVSERYTSGGQAQVNRTEGSSAGIRYNDSHAEISALATQFYQDFGTYSVSAAQCVRNFSDACSGKREEQQQIQDNRDRRDLRIVGSRLLSTPAVAINADRRSATFTQRCQFEDVELSNGRRWRVEGDCLLTAVYEDFRWWLCASHFLNGTTSGPFGSALDGSRTVTPLNLSAPGRRR